MKYIIEGIDRLGKSTLTQNIQDKLGYHLVIHYDKPQKLKFYERLSRDIDHLPTQNVKNSNPLYLYQRAVNDGMFDLMTFHPGNIVFDRGHLGECVYAPLYRDYDGDYVFELEEDADLGDSKLILLTTSNFDICVDDGESFNSDNKEKEQQLFIDAFNKSNMSKVLIDVYNPDTGTFKDPMDILNEALNN